ncbi:MULTISPECIES: hypothetical protein [unclassified Microcoleus]|uniref:hypothetical protein n=1 Tax=unclassified Microcoleus TaxID=2642155 RepID=UPI002FD3165D
MARRHRPKLGVTGAAGPARRVGAEQECDRHYPVSNQPRSAWETRKQPQNLKALAVDRSGHLMRKYRLTYYMQ